MTPPSQRSIRLQQDREKSKDLLRIYGGLLTPKQYAMTAGFVLEGKSFSQIAREHGISRQAVHEVVRSVQRLLQYYESKLLIHQRDQGKLGGGTGVVHKVRSLRDEIARRGDAQSTTWIVDELDTILHKMGAPNAAASVALGPEELPERSTRSASGGARKRRG